MAKKDKAKNIDLLEGLSKQLKISSLLQLEFSEDEDDEWRAAYKAMVVDQNLRPLAWLISRSEEPIPLWLRLELRWLLDPDLSYVANDEDDENVREALREEAKEADRLVFQRAKRTEQNLRTEREHYRIAKRVKLEMERSGCSQTRAVLKVAKDLNKTEPRYIWASLKRVKHHEQLAQELAQVTEKVMANFLRGTEKK